MKNFWIKAWKILKRIVLWFFALSIFTVIIYKWINPPFTPLMIMRVIEQAFDQKRDVKMDKDWISIDEMASCVPVAAVAAEDQQFEEHFGFDLDAIEKALEYNKTHKGKTVRGASTISQQVAKNVFLFPSRSYLRKGFEIYFTFLIEVFWSKKRILEMYLNIAEMGEGIYGIEAASQYYYKKSASKLTSREVASIIAILPNPRVWSPTNPNTRVARKIRKVLLYMKYIDLKEVME
ncbi:MAG TPA: monofunctional biosynthetic peptidoglycan transglycosylase [Bacteroidia bacterium]|nr:monofunctional biosynthetic peptidoglycan transglycosylase [Bacteroidia bacterium]